MNLALMHLIDSHIHILKTREHRIQGCSLWKQENPFLKVITLPTGLNHFGFAKETDELR